jgi:predicted transcriptional regulator
MKKNNAKLGQAELDLLLYVAKNGPMTVRQAQEGFGSERGYVRTTVLQMMERLRAKDHLTRAEGEHGLDYRATQTAEEIQHTQIEGFVSQTLKGSASPLVAFLAEMDEINDADIEQLRQIVEQAKKRGKK